MLSVVLLSLSAASASDDTADALSIDDESPVDEIIADEGDDSGDDSSDDGDTGTDDDDSEEDEDIPVVNQSNFNEYFNESGYLRENVTADELSFNGEFSDLGVNTIILNRNITINGNNSVLNNISIYITSGDVIIEGLTINQNNATAAIYVDTARDVMITDITINFNAVSDSDAYAIYAKNSPELFIMYNIINYAGATAGSGINNVIYLSNCSESSIYENKINAKLIACYVPWAEVPAGSGNWVSSPVSEGIVIEDSDDVEFDSNNITVTYTDIVGSYDTIYTVDFKNSDNAIITNNNINSTGNTYIYGIILSGDNFTIESNNITSTGDYYANGIDIEGPAYGVVEDNNITVKANTSVYAIYSGMNGQNVSANYTGNVINAEAYNVFGMSLGDVESSILNNEMYLEGNYTTGIAYRGSNITVKQNKIVSLSSEDGNVSVWEAFGVESVGIKVIQGVALIENNTISTAGKGLYLASGSEINVKDNFINVVGNDDKDAYAIYAINTPDLSISSNNVDYQGTTNGTGINNAVYLYNTTDTIIFENNFTIELVSCYVPWAEVPAGSGNWVSSPVSEGIVVEDSNGVVLDGNNVTTTYGDVVGDYDTIYVVDFKNSDYAIITSNNIESIGNTYIYGIIISGENFTIRANNITSVGDYYANGIDVEGPANGLIESNRILARANTTAYPVYGAMSNGDVSVDIIDNGIYGFAYLTYGIQMGGKNITVGDNNIVVSGNYTIGIGLYVEQATIKNNYISAMGTNEGNLTIWDTMGTATEGILIASGESVISNNTVATTGNSSINLNNNTALIKDNTLFANGTSGDDTISSTGYVVDISDRNNLKTILIASDLTKVEGSIDQYVVTVLDENGNPIAGKTITAVVNNQTLQATTDSNGIAKFDMDLTAGSYSVVASFAGTLVYASKNTTNTITVTAKPTPTVTKTATKITAKKKTFKAKKKTKKYAITLKAGSKAVSKVKVTIKVGKKTYKATTNAKGKATFKIKKLTKKGKYTATVKFAGNSLYKASSKKVKITVKK